MTSFEAQTTTIALAVVLVLVVAAAAAYVRYRIDISREWARISVSNRIETPCGPIEYSVKGTGTPLLLVHGAGGGFDQGLDLADTLLQKNLKVIAMSRFGYLRTPLPADASASAQADAPLCLLDALGIQRAAIAGVSAGGPSAMQFAIRHPDRTAALFLLVPLAYSPAAKTGGPGPSRSTLFRLYETLLKSDFLFWLAIHISPRTTIGTILATPPELVKAAERSEQERVARVMTHILPVSQRRLGLLNDAEVATTLTRYDLERITAPTLIVSVKDDRYGTFEGSRYAADHIAGARFVGFEKGGHMCVGHNNEIAEQAARFLNDNR